MTFAKILAAPVTELTFAAIFRRVEVPLALLAAVNPIALTKRNAVPMVVAVVVVLLVPGV